MFWKRAEIEYEFSIQNGKIVSPGMFEGETIYAPYFYESMMHGFGIKDDETEKCHHTALRFLIACLISNNFQN